MNVETVSQSLLLLAPGFVLLKVVNLFGEQHKRLEWEWVVWSLIAALPIAACAAGLRSALESQIVGPPDRWDAAEVALRFAVAIVVGILVAWAWRRVRGSRRPRAEWLRRVVGDSAWDIVLDDVVRRGQGVEVTVMEGDVPVTYYGKLGAFGYESAGAEPWVMLSHVMRWEGDELGHQALDRTAGLLLHKDSITRMRFIEPEPTEPPAE